MFLSLAPNNFEIILQEFILCYAIADIIGSPEILKLFGNLVLNITECNIYFWYKNKAFNFAKIGLGISMTIQNNRGLKPPVERMSFGGKNRSCV